MAIRKQKKTKNKKVYHCGECRFGQWITDDHRHYDLLGRRFVLDVISQMNIWLEVNVLVTDLSLKRFNKRFLSARGAM